MIIITSHKTFLAASHSQKGNHRDKRDLVIYDDIFE